MANEICIGRSAAGTLQARKPRGEKSWRSPHNQDAFILNLTATANVKQSAHAAGLSLPGAYILRQRDPAFRARWHDALCEGHVRLHALLIEGAAAQAEVPRDDEGEIDRIAARAYDPRVALALLKIHGPTVAGEARGRGQPHARSADQLRAIIAAKLADVQAALTAPTSIEEPISADGKGGVHGNA